MLMYIGNYELDSSKDRPTQIYFQWKFHWFDEIITEQGYSILCEIILIVYEDR